MSKQVVAYIALGSNLNNPVMQLHKAIKALAKEPAISILKISSYYLSKALYVKEQDDFYNAVISIVTKLEPEKLLELLLKIEQQQGRTREYLNGPRTLDLDIISYGDLEYKSDTLQIPHSKFKERAFVLYPLIEIAPFLFQKYASELKNVAIQNIKKLKTKEHVC